jgi:hypothetical protein
MLQVLHLYVVKVDLSVVHVILGPICSSHILQLLGLNMQPHNATARPACIFVGVEGPPWCGRGTQSAGHSAGTGHEAARATVRAQDMEQHGPHVKQTQQAQAHGH